MTTLMSFGTMSHCFLPLHGRNLTRYQPAQPSPIRAGEDLGTHLVVLAVRVYGAEDCVIVEHQRPANATYIQFEIMSRCGNPDET